jgi:hypothetical protein
MTEPLPKPAFDVLLDRAGLTAIAPAEREDIRLATRHLTAYLERIRTPAPEVALEPAVTFDPAEAAT